MQSDLADDPYSVLGLTRAASADELKRAYRKLSMSWHPDRHTGGSDAERREAERRFKLINSAYVTIGELLRNPTVASQATPAVQAEAAVAVQSDSRIAAIESVVASVALRVVPNLPRHAYRRVIGVVEQVLFDTIALGERAFVGGFSAALRDAMLGEGMDTTLRDDALKVLDAVVDELQWRGKGADPQTWQRLLRPLERARDPQPVRTSVVRPLAAGKPRAEKVSLEELLRPEPALVVLQGALAVLALGLLLPLLPLAGAARFLLLVLDLGLLGFVTFGPRR